MKFIVDIDVAKNPNEIAICDGMMDRLRGNGYQVHSVTPLPEKTNEKKPFDNVDARVLAAAAQQYSVNLGLEMARASLRVAQQELKDSNEELQKAKLARKARDGY